MLICANISAQVEMESMGAYKSSNQLVKVQLVDFKWFSLYINAKACLYDSL